MCVSHETSKTLATPAEVPRALPIAPDKRHSRRAGSPRAPAPPRHPPPADADVTMHERRPVTRGHRSSWNQACDLNCREGSYAMLRQGRHQRRLQRERQNRRRCRRPIARRQGRGGQTPPRVVPNRPSQPDHPALEWVPRPKRWTLYSDDSRRGAATIPYEPQRAALSTEPEPERRGCSQRGLPLRALRHGRLRGGTS